jgi:hypothetical protein
VKISVESLSNRLYQIEVRISILEDKIDVSEHVDKDRETIATTTITIT